jgi:Cu2+-exporting ATPase
MVECKRKFRISLILTLPVFPLSEMIKAWFNFNRTIPFQKEVLFLLSLILYLYGGWPFLKGLVQEIRNRQPGMMTLIATAISAS